MSLRRLQIVGNLLDFGTEPLLFMWFNGVFSGLFCYACVYFLQLNLAWFQSCVSGLATVH